MSAPIPHGARRQRGFTLLELVFVVGMIGVLISIVASIFFNITRNTERAASRVREVRTAAAVLDRIASDIESAYLVRKEPDRDPLSHPWVFIADSQRAQAGADRLMFTTVAHRSDAIAINPTQQKSAAGLATYAYLLEPGPDASLEGNFDLIRWVNPFLAEEHAFPRPDDPAAMLVAENVAAFSLRFQDEDGGWQDHWDSTLIQESGELPISVEIRLALWPDLREDEWEELDSLGESFTPIEYRRSVILYQRTVMSASEAGLLIFGGSNSEDEDGEEKNCIMTYAECRDLLKPTLTPAGANLMNSNLCIEDYQERLFDAFGNRVDFTKCGRAR